MQFSRTLILALVALGLVATAQAAKRPAAKGRADAAVKAARTLGTRTRMPVRPMAGGLRFIEVKPGKGPALQSGYYAVVCYTGWLVSGKEIDAAPVDFRTLAISSGPGTSFAGLANGIVGMKAGGVRKVIIPPALGPGRGPEGSTYIYEIRLIKIGEKAEMAG